MRLSTEKKTRRERPKSAPYLRLKNIQGTTIGKIWKKNYFSKKNFDFFFEKKYFLGRTMPKNSKRGHSGSFNVFYKPKTSKKMQLIESENFRKKSRIVPKKKRKKSNETKQSFGLASTFGNIKNLWFSARIEPTISCFSEN